jgi:hypothetical protein
VYDLGICREVDVGSLPFCGERWSVGVKGAGGLLPHCDRLLFVSRTFFS